MKNPEKLRAVIDTNILLVSISTRSKYHWLYESLINGKFRIAVTHDILLEYEEMIGSHWSQLVASITELCNFYSSLLSAEFDFRRSR